MLVNRRSLTTKSVFVLQMYEKGLMDERKAAQYYARIESGEEADVAAFADVDVEEHNRLAQAGIARTTLRTGDVPRGIGLAVNSENSALQRECGAILEAMKQWQVKTPPLSPLRFFPQNAVARIVASVVQIVARIVASFGIKN